jgi:cytoskeleton-associated protein 5
MPHPNRCVRLPAIWSRTETLSRAQVSLNDIVEDVATFAKHKNPQVKAETLKFLVRALRSTRSPPSREDTKTFASLLLTGCEDGFEPVRTAAAEGLGTLMKVVGERVLAAQLEGLDDLRKARVREFFEKAEVKCKPTAAGAPAAAKKPVAAVAKAAPAGAPKPVRPPYQHPLSLPI